MIFQVEIQGNGSLGVRILVKQITPRIWECPFCYANWTEAWLLQASFPTCCGHNIYVTQIPSMKWGFRQNPSGGTTQMSGNARIWWDSSVNAYRMTVPFNVSFNELFKNLIPHSDRDWNKDSKTWTITERYFDPTKTLVQKMFGNVVVIDRATAEKASAPPPIKLAPIDNVFTQFCKLLPYESMRKAYLSAASLLHPDHGGDMGKMSDLNACWQRLEKEFYKKGG